MNKAELIEALSTNQLPDNTEVLINVSKYFDGEFTWDEIAHVDGTENGAPILLKVGKTMMG